MQVDPHEFLAELESVGEERVRINLASQQVYGAYKKEMAADWLAQKAQAREDSYKLEQIEIARSAAEAAREAAASARDSAREARTANNIAKAAVAVAIVSIITGTAINLFSSQLASFFASPSGASAPPSPPAK